MRGGSLKRGEGRPDALPLCVGVVPGARLGAQLTIRSDDRTLRLLVGVVLGVIAVAYGVGETLALV